MKSKAIITPWCLLIITVVLLLSAGPASPAVSLSLKASGFTIPVHITHAGDGSGRLFVVEKAGVVRIVRDGVVNALPFLDISARVNATAEGGLLSIAFPPGFAAKRYFYVYYTHTELGPNNPSIQVSRFSVSANPDVADPNSEVRVLSIPHPTFFNHFGGQLAFGPDGFLYLAPGDGGGGGDTFGNAQNPLSLLGKLLRIDVETPGCVTNPPSLPRNYCIPPGNPFSQSPGFQPEIWAFGLRNPFRFSFDRQTGDLFIGDVGQNLFEEIDFVPAGSPGGLNFGWNFMEGFSCFNALNFNLPLQFCNQVGLTLPVFEYNHSLGDCSVTGGMAYRGFHRSLRGRFLYGDFCSGRIWGLRQVNSVWQNSLIFDTAFSITTFGEDEAGEVYVADSATGSVHRFAVTETPGIFRSGLWALDASGNFSWDGPFTDRLSGFGLADDIPVTGDWNGDGRRKTGIFRNGLWALDMNGNGVWNGAVVDRVVMFGLPQDIPVTGDWNGDGITDIGVFRGGLWALDTNGNGQWDGPGIGNDGLFGFGLPSDIPVTGNWSGPPGTTTKIGVFRNGIWALDLNGNGRWDGPGVDRIASFGLPSDAPVVGDWTGNGITRIGIFRGGLWALDLNGNAAWDGPFFDRRSAFGLAGDKPVAGNW